MIKTINISLAYLAQNHCLNGQVEFSIINGRRLANYRIKIHTQMCQNNFPKGNFGPIKSYCFSPKGNVEFEKQHRTCKKVVKK